MKVKDKINAEQANISLVVKSDYGGQPSSDLEIIHSVLLFNHIVALSWGYITFGSQPTSSSYIENLNILLDYNISYVAIKHDKV